MKRELFVSIAFVIVTAFIFLTYTLVNFAESAGELIMPLDDVYIHFQYARQLAQGQPYIYNTGDPATSGATSFIYPYILAIGYLIGFQGLNLGIWAMFVGCVALFASMLAIYRFCIVFDVPFWLAVLLPIGFALTGSISWHAVSGMETMLIVSFTLWVMIAFIEKRLFLFALTASLLALTRPEGSIMSGIATVIFMVQIGLDRSRTFERKHLIILSFPILAIGVQPIVNYLLTDSFSASGSQAKSLLALIPHDWSIIIIRIVDNFLRMWQEFMTGYSPSQDLWYAPILIIPLAIAGLLSLVQDRDNRAFVLLIMLWLVGVSFAISTLDTAFWHFKRYQLPLIALCLPLSAIILNWFFEKGIYTRWLTYIYCLLVIPLFAVVSFASFLRAYQTNVSYIRDQPLAMARWLADNTPPDALIAVHDVGMMRYISGRNTLDMVGLTTPSAAQYWRNGAGSVAEFLLAHQPDYIASYGRGHGYGLYMLADTRLYDHPLAEFRIQLDPKTNVAVAADYQAIYQPDWDAITSSPPENVLLDVNIANITSENAVNYRWGNPTRIDGFATGVYDFELLGCEASHSQSCKRIDGVRHMTGAEQFVVDLPPTEQSETMILETTVHPFDAITLEIYIDGNLLDTRWIPEKPGYWLNIQTRIPSHLLQTNSEIRIEPILENGEVYAPARHTFKADTQEPAVPSLSPVATYQDDHLQLIDYAVKRSDDKLNLTLYWYSDGNTIGDYRFFTHLYNDMNQPPIAQLDDYLGNSTLPLGNWLSGTRQDTINLNIDSLPAGTYQLVIGFYEASSHNRLIPSSNNQRVSIYDDGRLQLQDVEIE